MLSEHKNPGLHTEPSVTIATPSPTGIQAAQRDRDQVDDTQALYPVRTPAVSLSISELMTVSQEEWELARPRA